MADKATITLAVNVITNIGAALRESVNKATDVSSALTHFVTVAAKSKLPKTLQEPDVKAIVDAYAVGQRWEHDESQAKVRKSEARNLVRQHAYLSELVTAFKSATGSCTYHDAVKLCRLMKDHGNVGAAIKAATTKAEPTPVDPLVKFTSALQSFYQSVSESKSKAKSAQLKALNELAKTLGIESVKGATQGEAA